MRIDKNLNIFADDIQEKVNKYANTNVFVKNNIFSFFEVFEIINNQKEFINLITLKEKIMNIILKNDENIEKININIVFKKHLKVSIYKLK